MPKRRKVRSPSNHRDGAWPPAVRPKGFSPCPTHQPHVWYHVILACGNTHSFTLAAARGLSVSRRIKIVQYRIHSLELSTSMHLKNTPKILAFDTSSARGSVALLQGRELVAEIRLRQQQNHSENLLLSIRFLMNSLNWKLEDLNLIASGMGPGSFTGIRIGISTGLGIAQSLSIPFVGISGLEALAFQVVSTEGLFGVVLNAHRDQAYYAEYRNSGNRMRVEKNPSLIHISELAPIFAERQIYLIGDTALYDPDEPSKKKHSRPQVLQTDPYLAAAVGRRALSVKRRWKSGEYIQWEPLYIRPPDAVKKRARRS